MKLYSYTSLVSKTIIGQRSNNRIHVDVKQSIHFTVIVITLFSHGNVLKLDSLWGRAPMKSNQIINTNLIILVFEERGKPEYPEKNLSEQNREPTNSTHIRHRVWESNLVKLVGVECSHQCPMPAPHSITAPTIILSRLVPFIIA